MSTYVQLDRDDIERWLTSNRWDWTLKDGTAGIYLLALSSTVSIHFSSTVGRASEAKGHAKASANMKLVSTVTGRTLNKKAKGQSRFHRTTNWAKNWNDGLLRLKAAYEKSKGFYDALAEIEDQDEYREDLISRIETFPNWSQNDFLSSLHTRLSGGGVLTIKQKEALERMESRSRPSEAPSPAPTPSQPQETPQDQSAALLNDLRALWVVVPAERDWITALAAKVKRGAGWSSTEGRKVDQLLRRYHREIAQAKRDNPKLRQASAAFLAATIRMRHR